MTARGTVTKARRLMPSPVKLLAASWKFGSMIQNISRQRAKSMKITTAERRVLSRFRFRERSRQKGISQWQMKSAEQITHHPPRIRDRYHGISSGTLPDQMMRNSAKVR